MAAGGHPVTINDSAENAWLMQFIRYADRRRAPYPALDPGGNLAWIGYRYAGGTWGWAGGEPLNFTNLDYVGTMTWDDYWGTHASLHEASHTEPGVWNHNQLHDQSPDTFGEDIKRTIEIVPEPSSLLLFAAAAGLALLRHRR